MNSTISVIRNESVIGQQNLSCVLVDSSSERTLCVLSFHWEVFCAIHIVSTWTCADFFNFSLLISSKRFACCNGTVCVETNLESFWEESYCGIYLVSVSFTSHCSLSCNDRSILYTAIAVTLKLHKKIPRAPLQMHHVTPLIKKRRQAI